MLVVVVVCNDATVNLHTYSLFSVNALGNWASSGSVYCLETLGHASGNLGKSIVWVSRKKKHQIKETMCFFFCFFITTETAQILFLLPGVLLCSPVNRMYVERALRFLRGSWYPALGNLPRHCFDEVVVGWGME